MAFHNISRAVGNSISSIDLLTYLRTGQTFEGGISGCPQTEAHGAYVFCALACLSILGPPQEMIPKYFETYLQSQRSQLKERLDI